MSGLFVVAAGASVVYWYPEPGYWVAGAVLLASVALVWARGSEARMSEQMDAEVNRLAQRAADDAEIKRLNGEITTLRTRRMDALPRCRQCSGTGQTGIPQLMTVCSVCRGLRCDMAALWDAKKAWGERG